MKTQRIQTLVAVMAVGGLALLAPAVHAQNTPVTAPAVAPAAAPPLAYGVSEILRLSQAKVGDDTIIAYIKNSGNGYGLTADQIIYLTQQGVSTAVINVMLNQPTTATSGTPASQPAPVVAAPAPAAQSQPAVATTTVAPTVTYVQTVPTTYYDPYYYPGYYGYGYGWGYPAVSLSFGWGGRWGGGWHGGGHGGWHR